MVVDNNVFVWCKTKIKCTKKMYIICFVGLKCFFKQTSLVLMTAFNFAKSHYGLLLLFFFLQKGEFIGRDALLKQRENGISKRFAQFFLNDFDYETDVWPWGGEPIYRNGKYCGTITSTGYAHTLERMTCLGFVTDTDSQGNKVLHKAMHEFILDKSAKYEIAIAGKKFPAEVNLYTKPTVYQNGEPVFIPAPKR